jgi:ubiquinone/menaquinone biosynthesis C-methylase UbiE
MAGVGDDYEQIMVPAIFGTWAPVMADFVKVVAGERALDVACGTGVVARELLRHVGAKGTVVGCDSNAAMLATAGGRATHLTCHSSPPASTLLLASRRISFFRTA